MRSVTACLLLVHVLLSALAPAGLVEVLRIPALCDHYQEHFSESGGTISWGDFLVLHYVDVDHEKKDGNRHGELPFHNIAPTSAAFIPNSSGILVAGVTEPVITYGPMPLLSFGEWPGRVVFHPPKPVC